MLITDQNTLEEFCAALKGEEFITVDTEFLREKTYYPKLCLVQVCGADTTKAGAIDPVENADLDLSPLYDLLFDPDILKIFHAGRQDLEIFFNLTGKVVAPFFDTQIAAMVCGFGDSVGYDNLVRTITGAQVDKSSQFTDWSRRPLSDKQLHYALGDVTHLVDIYHKLSAQLEKRGRTAWVFEEEETLTDPATYQIVPENTWKRIKIRSPKPKTLAILRELAAWREIRAQDKDLPRPWVMKDDVLANIAGQAPKDKKQLSKMRGLSADLANGHIGAAILEAVKRGEDSDPKAWPEVKKKKGMPPEISSKVDILKMLLKIQANEHEVAAKLIASVQDLEAIAMKNHEGSPVMKGWRYEVFGEDALALKRGQLAIGLKGSIITKYRISDASEQYE